MDRVGFRDKIIYVIRKYKYALFVLFLGLVLLLIPNISGNSQTTGTTKQPQPEETADVTEQLGKILSQIQGAGKVDVLLTIRSGEKTIYQTDEDITGGETVSTRVETVIITNADRSQSGLIQQINPPTYMGAIVVCQGADRPAVRLAIVEAVSKVTGLGADRISVLKMK